MWVRQRPPRTSKKMLQTSKLTSDPHGTKPEGRQEERMREPATRKKDEPSHSLSAQGTQPENKEPEARQRGAPSRSLMAQGQGPNTRKRSGRGPKKMRHLHEAPPEVRAAKEDIRAKAKKAYARNSTPGWISKKGTSARKRSDMQQCGKESEEGETPARGFTRGVGDQGGHPCESQEGTCT